MSPHDSHKILSMHPATEKETEALKRPEMEECENSTIL